MSKQSFELGYKVAVKEILDNKALKMSAKDRGIFLGQTAESMDWDRGYETAVTAYRLGHNIKLLCEARIFSISSYSPEYIISQLINNTWPFNIKNDPRKNISIIKETMKKNMIKYPDMDSFTDDFYFDMKELI